MSIFMLWIKLLAFVILNSCSKYHPYVFFLLYIKVAYNLLKCLLNSPLMHVKAIHLRGSILYTNTTMDFKFDYQTQRKRQFQK